MLCSMSLLNCHTTVATVLLGLLSVPANTKLVYVEENLPLDGEVSPPGSPWPLPLNWLTDDKRQVTLDSNFTITANLKGCDVIDAAVHRYTTLTLLERPPNRYEPELVYERQAGPDPGLEVLSNLNVHIRSEECDEFPSLSQDEEYEEYKLVVEMNNGSASANLSSKTVWGALRGLETFSQLVYITEPSYDGSRLVLQPYYRLNLTTIEDKPRFKHRGLLLDTARHFIPKHILLQVLDSMSWNKLNVFHWHIVDDQSFPYESRLFKNLTEFGAYTPRHVYTQADVEDILHYAQLRGIRVIPEFDTPGHTQGFGKAFPHLLTPCYGDGKTPGTANLPYHAAYENFDPTNKAVYDFMRSFLTEVNTVFRDYIHLGLDEVFLPCWSYSPKVHEFMEKNNYTDPREVEQHYVREILRFSKDTGFPVMTWQDPAERGVQMENNSIVQIWKDVSLSPTKMRGWQEYVHDLTEKGYNVILSSCWYINFITYGQDWKNFYNCDPTDFSGTEEQKKLVLGGEAAMWGEYVDATNLMPRLWPRASAAAERLWSQPLDQGPSADDAASRLDQHRCRMLRRGISAQPILNGFCGEWEVPEHVFMSTTPTPTTTTTTPPPTTPTPTTPTTPPTPINALQSTTDGPTNVTTNVTAAPLIKNQEGVKELETEGNKTEILDEHPHNNLSTTTTSTESTTTTTTAVATSSTTTTATTTIPTTTTTTEQNVETSSGVVIIEASSNNIIPDTSGATTASSAPLVTVESLSATVKYIENKEESNTVEEQNDSKGTA